MRGWRSKSNMPSLDKDIKFAGRKRDFTNKLNPYAIALPEIETGKCSRSCKRNKSANKCRIGNTGTR